MGFDPDTNEMDWHDELIWIGTALVTGVLLSLVLIYFQRFASTNIFLIIVLACSGIYLLGILLRIQNYRGQFWLGRTIVEERKLKFIAPAVGFAMGLALLVF